MSGPVSRPQFAQGGLVGVSEGEDSDPPVPEGAESAFRALGWCLVDGKHIARTLFPTRELAQARADRWNAHDGYAFVVCALVPDGAR